MSCFCYCSVTLPHGAMGWSAVCDFCILQIIPICFCFSYIGQTILSLFFKKKNIVIQNHCTKASLSLDEVVRAATHYHTRAWETLIYGKERYIVIVIYLSFKHKQFQIIKHTKPHRIGAIENVNTIHERRPKVVRNRVFYRF